MSEVIVVSGRRRSWPEDVKRRLLAEASAPGESICSVARRYELDPAQLYQWRRKFREADAGGALALPDARFLPVDIERQERPPSAGSPLAEPGVPTVARPKTSRGARPKPERMEIVLLNGRRLMLPLSMGPTRVKELADLLERA